MISSTPLMPRTAASTRPPGSINVQLPAPGFKNETDFWHAKLEFDFADSFALTYNYGNVDAKGQARTLCCMRSALSDWLRVGELIANGGRVGDRQVVPAGYVAEMLKRLAQSVPVKSDQRS